MIKKETLVAVRTGLAATAVGLLLFAPVARRPNILSSASSGLAFAMITAMAVAASLRGIRLYWRDAFQMCYLAEIGLVAGAFFLPPISQVVVVCVARLATALRFRNPWHKSTFNMGKDLLVLGTFLVAFRLVIGISPTTSAIWYPAVLLGLLVSGEASALVFGILFASLGRTWSWKSTTQTSMVNVIQSVLVGSVGFVGVLLFRQNPVDLLPLMVLLGGMLWGFNNYGQLRNGYQRVSQSYEFAKLVAATAPSDEGIEFITNQARQVLDATEAELVLASESDDRYVVLTSNSSGLIRRESGTAEVRPFLLDAIRTGSVHVDYHDGQLAVPMRIDQDVFGVMAIEIHRPNGKTFDDDDKAVFEAMASQTAIWLDNGRLVDRLRAQLRQREHDMLHDALTGLPNRRQFQTRSALAIENAQAVGDTGAVILLDLDAFKDVNDTLGHAVGDDLLRQIADRLLLIVPQNAVVARLGGDEFAILLPRLGDANEALGVGRDIARGLREPITVGETQLQVDTSLGIAVFPQDGIEAPLLLQYADLAMYAAKSKKTVVERFRRELDMVATRRLNLMSKIRNAIEQGEMELHYQPKVDLEDGSLAGVEALIRWTSPIYGPIRPDEFIPMAEETGAIADITMFVLREGIQQQRKWADAGIDIDVAINLSVRNLLDVDLSAKISAMLHEAGVDPQRITLEITESSVMNEIEVCVTNLHALAQLGVRLAIDDFGTGQSSLAYLQQLPVHEVKIDRRFLRELDTNTEGQTIVRTVLGLASSLHFDVVAEGVETPEVYEYLLEVGCSMAQGYYIGRPGPAEDLEGWLSRRHEAIARHHPNAEAFRGPSAGAPTHSCVSPKIRPAGPRVMAAA